ncbi:MAG: diphthine synthase [Nanoarchaeota archaeon]
MLYLIGLGLNEKGISQQSLEVLKKCKKIYLENYTVDFPYSFEKLEEVIKKKIISADRGFVESLKFLDEAKKIDIALLVYGSPLVATTHVSILEEAEKQGINLKVFHNASILDAIGETGLQIYKFGKITSMPSFEADSYMNIVKQNLSIEAHSLILIDIGLNFKNALEKLIKNGDKYKIKLDKIIVCSQLGTDNFKVYYGDISKLKTKKIEKPFCLIIPSLKLHYVESDFLKNFEK